MKKASWLTRITSSLRKKKQAPPPALFDLQEIFAEVNARYFNSELALSIDWYGTGVTTARTSVRLAYYHQKKEAIRVSRLLSSPLVPRYFLGYVIYHEMLHHVYPPLISEGKRRKIHHKEFLAKEKEYHDYVKAKEFLKKHSKALFHKR